MVAPGGTVGTGGDATPADPVEAAVTSPHAGAVTVMEFSELTMDAFGYELFGPEIRITAPVASPGEPLRVDFRLDPSIVPAGHDESTLAVLVNGVLARECGPAPAPAPIPASCAPSIRTPATSCSACAPLRPASTPWAYSPASAAMSPS